jgi:hypothetical protein
VSWSQVWIWVLRLELLVTLAAATLFLVLYLPQAHLRSNQMSRHWALVALAGAADVLMLLLLLFGVRFPVPVYALVYGAGAAVTTQRVAIYLRIRFQDRREERRSP